MKRLSFALVAVLSLFLLSTPPAYAAFGLGDSKDEASKKADTVYDVLRNQKDLSKFLDMISDAGMKDLFTNKDATITVFAPNNSAISNISSATMKKIKASKESLQNFIKYHVVNGSHMGSSAINGRKASTAAANGETIALDGTSIKDGAKVNDAHIVTADLSVGSSVVHVISAALLPASLSEKAEAQPPAPSATPSPAPPNTISKAIPDGAVTAPVSASVRSPETEAPAAPDTAPPASPPADDSSKGFNLFGHHFGN